MTAQRIEQLAEGVTLAPGDCRAVLPGLDANSLDSCVTDPPYGLGFMGKGWDHGVPDVAHWRAIFRVLKPGAHLLSFGGTRTYHRMACAIEDAGFEIRDSIADLIASDTFVRGFLASLNDEQRGAFARCIDESQFGGILQWAFGQGFPKSLDVSKAIDKAAGAERKVVGERKKLQSYGCGVNEVFGGGPDKDGVQILTAPATDAARQWSGYGTALKPAVEPIILARKPLSEPTVAANCLRWGVGALNIDGCRVDAGERPVMVRTQTVVAANAMSGKSTGATPNGEMTTLGRWPANLIHDGSEEVIAAFPADTKSGVLAPHHNAKPSANGSMAGGNYAGRIHSTFGGDSGSAARFFYSAKADAMDRLGSKHPTVKPIDLMQFLVRLVTPKGGTVLDPFAGTGTTGEAAFREGMKAVLIEREEEYCADIRRRIALLMSGPQERKREGLKARNADKPADHGPLFV